MCNNIVNVSHEVSNIRQTFPYQYIDNKCIYGKFSVLATERYYSESHLLPLLFLESTAQMSLILMPFLSNKVEAGYLTKVDDLNYFQKITIVNMSLMTIKVSYIIKRLLLISLKQKPQFRFIDTYTVVESDKTKTIIDAKYSFNIKLHSFFKGRFPEDPIVPGLY